jgi:hypothetical protein
MNIVDNSVPDLVELKDVPIGSVVRYKRYTGDKAYNYFLRVDFAKYQACAVSLAGLECSLVHSSTLVQVAKSATLTLEF